MTKHEILHSLRSENLTISDILKIDSVSRVAIWKTIEKLRKEGCVRIAGYKGRARIYEITSRGLSKLAFYDQDFGCSNSLCSCNKGKKT